MRHDHILAAIGRTPVVRLARIAPPHVELYAKLEAFNPTSSAGNAGAAPLGADPGAVPLQ